MNILSNAQLNSICSGFLDVPEYLNMDYLHSLYTFYNTGLRTNELFQDKTAFQIYDEENIIVHTFKGSNPRIIDNSLFHPVCLERIYNNVQPIIYIRHDQINLYIRQRIYPNIYKVGKDEVTTYLFRYNKCRQMLENGSSLIEISEYFGWNNNNIVNGYCYNNIIY